MAKRRPAGEVKSNHALWAGLAAALIATALVAVWRTGHGLSELEMLERRTLDLRFSLRGARPVGPETILVVYDDKTFAEDPTLYERRAGWATLITALHTQGVKAIGIDAFFTDAEQILPAELARDLEKYVASHPPDPVPSDVDRLLERVLHETKGDHLLAIAIQQAGNVVLGVHASHKAGANPAAVDASLSRLKYGQVVPGPWQPRPVHKVIASLPIFNRAARGLGMMTVFEDDTQTVRAQPMVRALGDSVIAPLAVQLLAQWTGDGRSRLAYLGNEHRVTIGDRDIPLGDDDSILLNFRGPTGAFPSYSAIDLVKGRVDRAKLDGKMAIVGFTHLGRDRTRTPFGPGQPAVDMHATAIDNLLHRDWLTRAPWTRDLAGTLGLGLLVALLFWSRLGLRVASQVVISLALLGGVLAYGYVQFATHNVWWSWLGPTLALALTSSASFLVAYAREGLQRRKIRHAFGHYLSAGVIEELLANPEALALGGERRDLSVLFSDIRGFTSFSERLAPDQLVKVLNTYLTPMTGAVLQSGGFLDKFIGDAVMAVFGAPVPDEAHPAQALTCALRMHAELERIGPELRALGVDVEIGIGVNSGDMAVGNMGSAEQFNYTVMGDAVNLGSRLEGLTRTYGVFCLVGEGTRRAAPDGFSFREIDLVRVKGKAQPVAIYELLGGPERTIAKYVDLSLFAAGIKAYRDGFFPQAREIFAKYAAANPHDQVSALYVTRLATMGDESALGWDGVTVHTSK